MSKKKWILWTFLVLSAGITFRLASDFVSAQESPARVPFTLTQTYTATTSEGNELIRQEIELVVKSNGSRAKRTRSISQAGTTLSEHREIYDMVAGRITEIYPATNSKSSGYLPQPIVNRLSAIPAASCDGGLLPNSVVEANAGSILGFNVVKVTEQTTMPNGRAITNEEWRSPQLNCFPLRQRATVVASDGISTVNLTEVSTVVKGEPGAELFQISQGYTERSPSQVIAEIHRLKGESCVGCGEASVIKADQNYFGSQTPPVQ